MALYVTNTSSDINNNNVVKVKVPPKLLQINETAYTDEWSRNTFEYCHIFDKKITSFTAPRSEGSNDLHLWKMKAKNLTHEIKSKGVIAGNDEICRVANQYNMKVPGRPSHDNNCTSIEDVLHVIVDKNWYQDNVHLKRCIIYHLLYGITRSGNNTWLLNCEKKWMDGVGIAYDPSKIAGQRKTKVKGFVYSIMLSMFSNSTQKIFRKAMLEHHGEFITVRKKQQDPTSRMQYDYLPYEFGKNKDGYLVSIKDINDIKDPTNVLNVCHLNREGTKWLSKCKEAKLSYTHVQQLVQEIYFGKSIINVNNEAADKLPCKVPNEEVRHYLATCTNKGSGE